MKCDGSPDPTIQGEINTYINLWKEDMRSNDIANVLNESTLTLSVSYLESVTTHPGSISESSV